MSLGYRSHVRLPTGVRDFLPRAAARRRAIAERLLAVFESWGFERIITPMFECADVLERGLGDDARAAALRFVEPMSGEVVALRPDITPQVARIAATRLVDVEGPIRLCYEGAVTRLQAGPRGQREILQAGVELIGTDTPEGDSEAIAVAAAALAATQIGEVRLEIGHVALARHALSAIEDPERRREVEAIVAKKDRAGVARAAAGLPDELRAVLEALPTLFGPPEKVLARARALPLPPDVAAAVEVVQQVLDRTRDIVEDELHAGIAVDLGEVRGFEYYTGIRFSGFAAGAGDAVLRGGRYDELVGRYGCRARATGFAVDVEAVAQAQRACGMEPPRPAHAVLVVTDGDRRGAARLASALRARGVRAALDLGETRSAPAVVAYARSVGFSRVLVLGDDAAHAYRVEAQDDSPEPGPIPAEILAGALAPAGADVGPLIDVLALGAGDSGAGGR